MLSKLIWLAIAVECAVVVVFGICLWLRRSPSNLPQAQALAPCPAPAAAHTGEALVFVMRAGRWYHRGNCGDVRQSRIPVKLGQVRMYWRLCGKCRPPH
jgi:hypothetical protein